MTHIQAQITVSTINETFAVYMHLDPDDMMIKFVGVAPLTELFMFDDARCNSMWPSIFLLPGKSVKMTVDSTHLIEQDAIIRQRQLINELKPICNLRGYHIAPHRQDIVCNETGERWQTVRAAAAAHNLSLSALSNHLNGKVGHRTVKGRTYRRTV